MTDGKARRLAWSAFLLWILFLVSSAVFDFATKRVPGYVRSTDLLFLAITAAFPIVAMLILARHPRNRIGWILLAIGLWWALPLGSYGAFAYSRGLPGGAVALALNEPTWAPPIGLMGTTLLLRFPSGQLLSRRWKWVEWAAGVALGATAFALVFAPEKLSESSFPNLQNPLGIEALKPVLNLLIPFIFLIPVTVVASAISLILRFRRSQGVERLQLKWFTTGAAIVAMLYLISISVSIEYSYAAVTTPTWVALIQRAAVVSFILIPISIGFAILKHRLYDIDVVINKTVVFGALAAFITVVYVGVVVGIGALIGSGDEPNLGLSILATAIVAVAFQPVRERVQHFANRLVYGKRATPYEVLSEFSDRVAETYASQEVLPKMAQAIKDGTGAERAEVWLRSHDELRPAATWPEDATRRYQPLALTNGQLPSFDGADKAIEVRHQGELLGALTVTKPPGEPLTPGEDKLLEDLASQAGLVLRNVGLTAELLQRLEDLKASRQRLVAAQDEERRRLERNLHDGAQQHLIALKTRLSLAKRMTERDPTKAQDLIAKLENEADEALENLRDLARGIYPPLLADQGLRVALEAHARKLSIPVEVIADGISRYPQEIEAAVYFCCLEALQNVTKYANASRAVVRLFEEDGALTFSVQDDGHGFDPTTTPKGSGTQNMSDRLEALGGHLEMRSRVGSGTTATGSVPARQPEPVR